MNSLPENDPDNLRDGPGDRPEESPASPEAYSLELPQPEYPFVESAPPQADPPLFASWSVPQVRPPARIPHFGHLCLLGLFAVIGLLATIVLFRVALYLHLFGVSTIQGATIEIHYTLGSEAAFYLFTFAISLLIFPLFWHKSFFAGIQWNAATAFHLRTRLLSAAFVCFLLAVISGTLMKGPTNTPIERIFHTPGAAWLLFAFGITFAPFFEEMFFRGFLLPSLCTAWDWFAEKTTGAPTLPLAENGHPQWSIPAMVGASIAASIPFAWLHAAQTGHAFGPLLLLFCVSLVLCAVRLNTRSLAASVTVHACYNFLLFSIMLAGTDGFRHLDKM